jgi:hypothetical protein
MFFIFGSPRSGTTLLAASLDLHQDIFVADETDFIVPLAFMFDRLGDSVVGKRLIGEFIVSTLQFRRSLGQYLAADEVNRIIHETDYSPNRILGALYSKVAEKVGKKLAGDKSPNDLLFLRILVKTGVLSQGVKIVHIVRDVRDVSLSLNHWMKQPGLERWFPRQWSASNLYLYGLFNSEAEKYHLIKYEEMVRDPPGTLRTIVAFLGVPFDERVLDHSSRSPRYLRKDGRHHNLEKPFLASQIGKWQKQMTPEIQELCQTQAREALQVFGYVAAGLE